LLRLKEGAIVAVHGLEVRNQPVTHEIKAIGGKAFTTVGDLRSDEDAQGVADQALSALGGVDILINRSLCVLHGQMVLCWLGRDVQHQRHFRSADNSATAAPDAATQLGTHHPEWQR